MLKYGVVYRKNNQSEGPRILFARFATYEEALRCVHLIERRPHVYDAAVSVEEETYTMNQRTLLIAGAVLFDLILIGGLVYFYFN